MRSMSQIMRLHERAVQSYAEKLCKAMQKGYAESDSYLEMTHIWSCEV